MTLSPASLTTPFGSPHLPQVSPNGPWSARKSTVSGPRPAQICPPSSRACSQELEIWPGRRWRWFPAWRSRSCCSSFPSSLPGSSWPSASRELPARRSIFGRVMDPRHGEEFARLCTATIRAVAQGVLGVAFIQAIVVGVVLLIAGVPFPGVLAMIALLLGIAQIPALLVTLPVDRLHLVQRDLQHGGIDRLHRAPDPCRHAGQRTEAPDARTRCRCANARDPAGRTGRHGKPAASWECSSVRPCWPWAIRSSCGGSRSIRIPA